ncbi:MAG: ABC transporter permease [Bacteriovoracia bacterium]
MRFGLLLLTLALLIAVIGESPVEVAKVFYWSVFSSADNFSYVLYYVVPLLLTGTSVWFALQVGLFSIGAEGQMYIGAVTSAAVGIFAKKYLLGNGFDLGALFWIVSAFILSFSMSGIWALVAGYLRVKFGTHEVIATILLNFIALAFSNWAILYPLKNIETQNVQTEQVARFLQIPYVWHHAPAGILIVPIFCLVAFLIIRKTWWGFRIRTVGKNPKAAEIAGINTPRTILMAMFISGGLAGLAGFHEVFCSSYKLLDGFSPGYGFTGIAIALMCRGNLVALFLSAFLFAALHKGALDLDIETDKITKDLALVIQALMLLFISLNLKGIKKWKPFGRLLKQS